MKFRYWIAERLIIAGLWLVGQPDLLRQATRNQIEQRSRLARIAALETPGANATVRKMASIAKGEL